MSATHSTVVSLTLLDAPSAQPRITPRSKLFVGARSPRANETHPGVVSVPTMRVPSALFDAIRSNPRGMNKGDTTFYEGGECDVGLATALEMNEAGFTARLASVTRGVAVYHGAYGGPLVVKGVPVQEEPIAMANLLVRLSGRLPMQLPSYTRAAWVEVGNFLKAAAARDPRLLDEAGTFRDSGFTLEGVCVASTAASLARELERP